MGFWYPIPMASTRKPIWFQKIIVPFSLPNKYIYIYKHYIYIYKTLNIHINIIYNIPINIIYKHSHFQSNSYGPLPGISTYITIYGMYNPIHNQL